MPYYYTLLKVEGTKPKVLEEAEVDTLVGLQNLVEEHIGMCPDWLVEVSKDEYLQVEDEQGDFVLDIEGAEVM
jgi:hypothetical protein